MNLSQSPSPSLEELKKKLALLEAEIDQQELILEEKERLLEQYWDTIQYMRLVNRVRRIFPISILVRIYGWFFQRFSRRIFNGRVNALTKRLERQPIPLHKHEPLVSIIILNRNGEVHLRPLLTSVINDRGYKNFEIILFDNASTDGSVEFIHSLNFPAIRVIESQENLSFATANNRAAAVAKGEMLLFLNNDVKPLYGWLSWLVEAYNSLPVGTAGAIGSLLLYCFQGATLRVQHAGIGFQPEDDFVRPFNLDAGMALKRQRYQELEERIAVTGACLLVSRSQFEDIGGFEESYRYGFEDVDFCLKLKQKGYRNFLASKSILFHEESATQLKSTSSDVKRRRRENAYEFKRRWRDYLARIGMTKDHQS